MIWLKKSFNFKHCEPDPGYQWSGFCLSTGRHPTTFTMSGRTRRVEECPAEFRCDGHMAGKVRSHTGFDEARHRDITATTEGKQAVSCTVSSA